MSEYTQDEFVELPPHKQDAEVQANQETPSQVDSPAEAEPEQPGAEAPSQVDSPTEAELEQSDVEAPLSNETPTDTEEIKTLPPEAQGESNGGPLGCCLGTLVGLLLSISLAVTSRLYATSLGGALQGNYWLLGLIVRILMGVLAFACAIFFGYLGWKLGKRFYREYEPPPDKRRKRRAEKKMSAGG